METLYDSEDINFTQILPAVQYRLFGASRAYYQIAFGNFSFEAAFTKAGAVRVYRTDSDGD